MESSIIQIESEIRHVKEMCRDHIPFLKDTDQKALMTAAAEVLHGLEKALHTCFQDHEIAAHTISPKSEEPWD